LTFDIALLSHSSPNWVSCLLDTHCLIRVSYENFHGIYQQRTVKSQDKWTHTELTLNVSGAIIDLLRKDSMI